MENLKELQELKLKGFSFYKNGDYACTVYDDRQIFKISLTMQTCWSQTIKACNVYLDNLGILEAVK